MLAQKVAAKVGSNCEPARLPAKATAAPVPPMRWATSVNSPICANLDAIGMSSPLERSRASPCRPTARKRHRPRPAPPSDRPSCSASPRARAECWAIMPSRSRCPDTANSTPTRKRCSGGFPLPTIRSMASTPPDATQLMVVFAGLEGDVVPEPLRLLVGVGMATDVDQQCRVVDDRALHLRRGRHARPVAGRSRTGEARAP